MMSLWDALRMNMMISYQELVRTFLSSEYFDDLPAYILDTETMLMGINRKNRNVNDYNRAIRSN
ncbi:hypothetical protein [Escherichia coli]|nr:hypothetical protein [Escherichia coli]TBS21115.1 hypothetical protein DXN12_23770 [Salmonella enterica subsp. enterica serovar Typhimurium]MBW1537864.1 hypothetical protein [Escherichia coli]MBW1542691.1 hypothetical protein [Escherichia coli]MBZ2214912.1 hypothetical protein [Escherichia coli]MBZ2237456.1 hypothetical protein [Escherichia coli]